MKSLYDQVRDLFTPALMDRLSGYFGETGVPLERAVRAAVSSLVGGAIDHASTEDGATMLLTQSHGAESKAFPLADLRFAIAQGKPVAEGLLGDRLTPARELISGSSNVSASTASGLLALGAPLVMAVLGKLHAGDATEFGALLDAERGKTLDAGPAAVTSLVEDGGFSWRHILPMILMGLFLVALPFLYRGCGEAPAPEARMPMPPVVVAEIKPEKIALPNGGEISVLPGTINHALAKFLAGTEPVPKRFTFDHLNFEFNKTVITPESRPTLADLVTILRAYPGVNVLLEGHTDSIGDPAENKKLSVERAVAIQNVLKSDGVAAGRIATAGYGEEKPVATNENEEGRAKNRRLELVVVKK